MKETVDSLRGWRLRCRVTFTTTHMAGRSLFPFLGVLALGLGSPLLGQTRAQLRTSDTQLAFEASTAAPRLLSIAFPGQPAWENRVSETLIPSAEIEGKSIPLSWAQHLFRLRGLQPDKRYRLS